MSRNSLLIASWAAVIITLPVARFLVASPEKMDPVPLADADKGRELFLHDWTPKDPLCPEGDGLGPVFNAKSCVACHRQGGIGGSGPNDSNVTTYVVRFPSSPHLTKSGLVHTHATATSFQETLQQLHPDLPKALPRPLVTTQVNVGHCDVRTLSFPSNVHVSERKTPALFGAKLINDIPDSAILENERRQRLRWAMASTAGDAIPVGRAARLANHRIGHFGWKGQTASLEQFVQAACANELGLSNPAQKQPVPLSSPNYAQTGYDLSLEQCSQITAFVGTLPRPIETPSTPDHSTAEIEKGRVLFGKVGCADCHQPNTGDVIGLFSDLLLHDMGPDGSGGGSYGAPPEPIPEMASTAPRPGEWRTPPLWGVADAGPYLHDGRAATLTEAIQGHNGQGMASRVRFESLTVLEKENLLAFLGSLRAPSTDAD